MAPAPPILPPLVPGEPVPRVYLLGAGGCGMSALGHLLLDLGYEVSGADLAEGLEVRQLRERGAHIHLGHAAVQLLEDSPALVACSSAIPADNPERRAAEQHGIPVYRRALVLAELLARKRGVCVAGMHGKTTTSAMLAFALDRLQARPSFAVGSVVPQDRKSVV